MLPALIVFHHLRWSSAGRRPQQLISRLAQHYRVLYVEAPQHAAGAARLERSTPAPNVEVLTPRTPLPAAGFDDRQVALLRPLLADHLAGARIDDCTAWLYTPMALPLAGALRPRTVVYDCLGEPSASADASHEWRRLESALLQSADLVLTGGPTLYAAMRKRHRNVVCLPSAVDARHFSPAHLEPDGDEAREAKLLQAAMTGRRLGYFGVIDQRIDLDLVARLADQRPDWHIAMVGPLQAIDDAALPRRANLHWLGAQPYDRLPYLMAGWELCLMPFVVNGATQYLNPCKTLEYMAGEKPIVSSALPDVVALHGGVVRIAHDAPGFVRACDDLLAEPVHKRSRRVAEMLSTVSCTCWERSAASVVKLIDRELRKAKPRGPAGVPAQPVRLQPSVA